MLARPRLLAVAAFLAVAPLLRAADPRSPASAIPDELRPWTAWALHGHEQELCPLLRDGSAACAWPSRLDLDLGARTGRFQQGWLVRARTFAALPGDAQHWPLDVRAGGSAAAVIAGPDGAPGVWLDAGTWTIAGTFAWEAMPESLAVPAQTGLVSLRLDGREIASPQRDQQGRLWLQAAAGAPAEVESLTIAVHRLVTDEIPLRLITRILLEVSGKSREIVLGPALPQGFIPVSLEAPIPSRLEDDGTLRLQVRPGRWTIVIEARHVGPVTELAMPAPGKAWSPDEVWSFDARTDLRVVDVQGISAIDPQQTSIPDEWRHLPTYRILPGETMKVIEKRRGDADPAPDQLSLERTLWLDFDGKGITAQDQLGGTLSRSWRLESRPPWNLGRASVGGDDQLLTRQGPGAAPGLEIRQGQVSVIADSRIEGPARRIPAVGWDADVTGLGATLNLPPGWRLLGAPGVDAAGGTWISRWTLLDLFLALIVAVAVARLWDWPVGLLALATMGLTLTEDGAPRWIWLFVVALEALRRVLKHEKARQVVEVSRLAVLAVLLLVSVVFMLVQARNALHPQLENPWAGGGFLADMTLPSGAAGQHGEAGDFTLIGIAASPFSRAERAPAAVVQSYDRLAENAAPPQQEESKATSQRRVMHDPHEIVQTGPGIPMWSWRQVRLQWTGPVERGQDLRLVLASPPVTSVAGFLRILLLAALILRALLPRDFDLRRLLPRRRTPAGATAALVLACLATLHPTCARGEVPRQEILDQLAARLVERPPCGADCAEPLRLDLDASASTLRLRLEVAAAAESAVALPGGQQHWSPRQVLLDGHPADGLLRTTDGVLWLLVPQGVHQVALEGSLPARDVVQVPLPDRPKLVTSHLAGWTLTGVHDGGVPDDTLQLAREVSATRASDDRLAPAVLPPFVTVTRRIDLGITWNVATRVERVGPSTAPVLIRVPLLAGESVTSADIRVEDGAALVSLGPGVAGVSWQATLAEAPAIALKASDVTEWTEIWQLDASPSWHVEPTGIPPVHPSAPQDVRVREWRPWPGEAVTLAITRPEAVPGPSLTIDGSELDLVPGLRATDATLALSIRSSRGGQHAVTLPEGALLQSLSVNGLAQPVRQDGRVVTIAVTPGAQRVSMTWREPTGLSRAWRSPVVDLGVPSVNANVNVTLPERWVLCLRGPRLGPAVLFWSLLAVIALLALALSRAPHVPLGLLSWLLLLIGLSQVPAWMGGVVIAWFLLLAWRRRQGGALRAGTFDVVQVGLVIWTVASGVILFIAIRQGLLGEPQMQVAGNASSASQLNWYADRCAGVLPRVSIVSASLFAYHVAMLLWAFWLAVALLRWVPWGWHCFTEGGAWRRVEPKWSPKPPEARPPQPPAGAVTGA